MSKGLFAATRYHDFSYGHRVHGHESKCANMHGHNGRVYFRIEADKGLDKVGRVMDFSVIKEKLCVWLEENWDHKFLVWKDDPIMRELVELCVVMDGVPNTFVKPVIFESFVGVPFNPTAENMAQYLVEVVGPRVLMGTGCVLTACEMGETRKCSATYFREGG